MKRLIIIFSTSILLLLVFIGCENLFAPQEVLTGNDALGSKAVISSVYDEYGNLIEETGVLGPGADYRIDLPPGWQGFPEGLKNLIIYSHGYVTQGLAFEDTEEYGLITGAISSFVSTGYAVAYSCYAESGWAVKDGVIRTRQLRGYFVDKFGMPDHIFLVGVSEGALIVTKLAEQNPELFSGVLAMAGPIGGAELEFAHILNTRLMFDYFFKDMVKGLALMGNENAANLAAALGYGPNCDRSAMDVQPVPDHPLYVYSSQFIMDMAPMLAGLMVSNLPDAMEMASVAVDTVPLFPAAYWLENQESFIPEFAYTVATALWYNIYGTGDLLEKTHGKMPLDNTESVYVSFPGGLTLPPHVFGVDDVERFVGSRSAEQYLEHWYKPDGALTIPMVTLHITRDPAVPFHHETAYAIAAGYPYTSPMLTQIPVPGFGHGTLLTFLPNGTPVPNIAGTLEYISGAFFTLVAQVEALSTP